ncbi:hypothetical protein AwDysgo_06620 [Bacteroidales bacterium]|nr:hypothetical protein AwDysgo_06620 [Bacteroidales bacterium]
MNYSKHFILAVFIFSLLPLISCNTSAKSADFSAIERGFVSPPDSVQTSIYWYWISDNISKEGVIKDLHSMKEAGINRAFIGNIGLDGPYGKVKLFTDEWWDITHAALKTATALNIEIGIFNSPGWSQSGGPWIKPEQAMRYLSSSELHVKGPQKLVQKLVQTTADFQDVRVIAWPSMGASTSNMFASKDARIKLSDRNMAAVASQAPAKYIISTSHSFIDLILPTAATVRSFVIKPAGNISANCELQVKEGDAFRTVKKFNLNRSNASLNVGFDPFAPIAVSFPASSASEFRVVFDNVHGEGSIKELILTATPIVERYSEKSLAKMFQSPLPYWHDYLWQEQTAVDPLLSIAPANVRDISQFMTADGTLSWDVPEGEWTIMRTGMAPTGVQNGPASPEGVGLEVDKMSKEHVAAHFDAFIGKIIERIPAADRKSWKVVVQDSYETGGQNFTDDFLSKFKVRYGYDAIPYLPVMQGHCIGSPDLSDRFLWDVRRMVADKVSYDYVGGLREVCHRHGLTTWLENYGHWGFPGEFLQYGGQSDEIGGEFWSEGNLGDIENRAASSCAHIYGKTKVSAESFTCAGEPFSRYPATMKRRGDWSFTEGINNTLLHVYIHQAYEDRDPGINEWFGNEFNRKNTWFSHIDLFTTYLKRCNFMLQQGLDVADVAYFIGEDAPKMTGVRDPELPKGYSFDYINAEVIVRDLAVENGRLVLPHGTSYKLLVLPKLETMRPEVLEKIEQLIADGAVVLGPPPSRSPSMEGYPESDQRVASLAAKMWGDLSVSDRQYGKGRILTNMDMQEAFAILNIVPDCKFADEDPMLYTHRNYKGKDIYFVTNQSEHQVNINPEFRVKGMLPELWNPVSGTTRPLPAYVQNGETTTIPIQLDALESAFIIFRKEGTPNTDQAEKNYPESKILIPIDATWEVQFDSDKVKRGPDAPVTFTSLSDWSLHEDERIRYYSGTAVYKTKFSVDKKQLNQQLFLDLGKVSVMAKVNINGKYAGGVWTSPCRLDVSKLLVEGYNVLEVELVNTWVNRLIGDQKLPENERPTWLFVNTWNADSQLQPSGLMGPVAIIAF